MVIYSEKTKKKYESVEACMADEALYDAEQEKALQSANELRSILDNQNAWIYIIDPDTCQLKYLNKKTKALAPEVAPGMKCYSTLLGCEERCEGCPSRDIRKNKTASAVLYNRKFDLDMLAEATLIQWEGQESCLLTCRELSAAAALADKK